MNRFKLACICTFTILACLPAQTGAEEWPEPETGPDAVASGSVEAIRQHTTSPRFLSPEVAYVPAVDGVPAPADVLGYLPGAAGKLTGTVEVQGYMAQLAEASPRVTRFKIEQTEEGREIWITVISSADNIRFLNRTRNSMAALADPRATPAPQAAELIKETPLVYYLNGGLHSPELGSPEMLMELAHRLAVSEREVIRKIRGDVVVVINAVSEPDGRDKTVEWYRRHLQGKTDFDDLPPRSPPYWGKYIFHDNNRDAIQATSRVSQAALDIYFGYHPVVMLDLHESVPFLYASTGTGPYNPDIDPLTIFEWQQMASYDVGRLMAADMPGAWTWGFYDGWSPNYLIWIGNTHNGIGRFYETFGNGTAETVERDLGKSNRHNRYAGQQVTDRTWYRPVPPMEKVTWSLRNNTNYMQTAVLAALEYGADHRVELLRNFYRKGERAVARGSQEPPHAWFIPQQQDDRWRAGLLLNVLFQQGIETHHLTEPFSVGEREFPAGTHVVRLDQPYRNLAHSLLSSQQFPAGSPRAYDDVSWCLPLLYGVESAPVDDPDVLGASMEMISGYDEHYSGTVEGTGPVFLLADHGQNGVFETAQRLLQAGLGVLVATEPFSLPGSKRQGKKEEQHFPRGSLILDAHPELQEWIDFLAENLGVDFVSTEKIPAASWQPLTLPQVGVYEPWTSTQDSGWVRYTLDRTTLPYDLLHDADLRGGALDGYDVIIVPNARGELRELVHGIDPRHGPLAFTSTPEYPSHGLPAAAEDITGGMGLPGLENLFEFVRQGGVLIGLANGGTLAVDGGLTRPVKRVRAPELKAPGSEVQARFLRPRHPIAWGYHETPSVFRREGPLWNVAEKDRELVVLQFGGQAPPMDPPGENDRPPGDSDAAELPFVLSGGVEGEKEIIGKPAILDVPVGEGRVVLFAFNPMHRYLNHSDFRLLYNAVMYVGQVETPAAESEAP